ncbi:MAG: hypothetical protein Q9178_004493 [Gyalolechia marmorata]
MSEEEAWNGVVQSAREAVESHDLDDFRKAIHVYQKAVKEVSYEQLERSFRTNDIGIFIIATEPREGEILDTHTLVDLSGKKDCKYKVSYSFKKTPRNGKLAEVWPASEEENLARLKDAGAPFERGITKCLRCKVPKPVHKSREKLTDRRSNVLFVRRKAIKPATAHKFVWTDSLAAIASSPATEQTSVLNPVRRKGWSARSATKLVISLKIVQLVAGAGRVVTAGKHLDDIPNSLAHRL